MNTTTISMKEALTVLRGTSPYRSALIKEIKTKPGQEQLFTWYREKNTNLATVLRNISSQSYGPLMQKIHIRHNKLEKVAATEDRGDFRRNKSYYEYKFTIQSSDGKTNFVQIRPWQKCDYVFEVLNLQNELELYYVPKRRLMQLVEEYGGAAHGTKEANSSNKKVEYALRPTKNNDCWNDLQKYRITREELSETYDKQ